MLGHSLTPLPRRRSRHPIPADVTDNQPLAKNLVASFPDADPSPATYDCNLINHLGASYGKAIEITYDAAAKRSSLQSTKPQQGNAWYERCKCPSTRESR